MKMKVDAATNKIYDTALRNFKSAVKEYVTQEQNKLNATFMAHDINEDVHLNMALKAVFSKNLTIPSHLYDIIVRDLESLSPHDMYRAKYEKFKQMVTIEYLEECLERSKPICENVWTRLYGTHEKAIIFIPQLNLTEKPPKDHQPISEETQLFEGQNVLLVFDSALTYDNVGFFVYQGQVYASKSKGAYITFSPGENVQRKYNENRRVTIFVKPHLHVFEDRLRGLVALRDDPVIQLKLHPSERVAAKNHHTTFQLLPGSRLNHQQLRVVTEMYHSHSDIPFVLWGPPGSGKTTTIVEFLIETFQRKKDAHVLVLCETNTAADCITEMLVDRLLSLGYTDLYEVVRRIMPKSRYLEDVSKKVQHVSNIDEYGNFLIPHPDETEHIPVVISTIGTITRLYKLGKNHFSDIIFEESSQISEMNVYIPLAPFCSESTKIYFAGDPEQLAPIVLCQALSNLGPNIIMPTIVRLCRNQLYRNHDPHYLIQLYQNYRSNKFILWLYSILSYGDWLEAMYTEPVHSMLAQNVPTSQLFHHYLHEEYRIHDRYLQNVSPLAIPIRWHICIGNEDRDEVSHSIYNEAELGYVQMYVARAVKSGVKVEEIGVITPYRAQVEAIKQYLFHVNYLYAKVKVGTVEDFQGLEMSVIIFSLVRSETIGFLQERRRNNTAISRAKNALIIIGDPFVFLQTNMGGHLNYNIRMLRLFKSWKLFVQSPVPLQDGTIDNNNLVQAIESIIPDGELPGEFPLPTEMDLNELEDFVLAQDSHLH